MNAEDVKLVMNSEPQLLKLAEGLREKFGAKLIWLKTPTVEYGKRVTDAVRAI